MLGSAPFGRVLKPGLVNQGRTRETIVVTPCFRGQKKPNSALKLVDPVWWSVQGLCLHTVSRKLETGRVGQARSLSRSFNMRRQFWPSPSGPLTSRFSIVTTEEPCRSQVSWCINVHSEAITKGREAHWAFWKGRHLAHFVSLDQVLIYCGETRGLERNIYIYIYTYSDRMPVSMGCTCREKEGVTGDGI